VKKKPQENEASLHYQKTIDRVTEQLAQQLKNKSEKGTSEANYYSCIRRKDIKNKELEQ
jgi:hypothetical protein